MAKAQEHKKSRRLPVRRLVQAASALLHNGYPAGFLTGGIYQGPLKHVCVPGLNCYSCPGALGACPIGSLQAVIGGPVRDFSYYVFGSILFFGVVLGRFVCGLLCPFGFFQDLLYKVASPKPQLPTKADRILRRNKFLVLALLVFLPMVLTDDFGYGAPFFCKWFCPVGTLEGAIPLALANRSIGAALGVMFYWKLAVLVAILMASILIYRPFCKYFCPLGALYGLLNQFSAVRYRVDPDLCVHCGACARVCKMGVEAPEGINGVECVRCGDCLRACPVHAIALSSILKKGSDLAGGGPARPAERPPCDIESKKKSAPFPEADLK